MSPDLFTSTRSAHLPYRLTDTPRCLETVLHIKCTRRTSLPLDPPEPPRITFFVPLTAHGLFRLRQLQLWHGSIKPYALSLHVCLCRATNASAPSQDNKHSPLSNCPICPITSLITPIIPTSRFLASLNSSSAIIKLSSSPLMRCSISNSRIPSSPGAPGSGMGCTRLGEAG